MDPWCDVPKPTGEARASSVRKFMTLPPAYSPSDKDAMSDGDARHLRCKKWDLFGQADHEMSLHIIQTYPNIIICITQNSWNVEQYATGSPSKSNCLELTRENWVKSSAVRRFLGTERWSWFELSRATVRSWGDGKGMGSWRLESVLLAVGE